MRCLNCDYDLTGLPVRHRCPECGERFDHRARRRPAAFAPYPRKAVGGWLRAYVESPCFAPLTSLFAVACAIGTAVWSLRAGAGEGVGGLHAMLIVGILTSLGCTGGLLLAGLRLRGERQARQWIAAACVSMALLFATGWNLVHRLDPARGPRPTAVDPPAVPPAFSRLAASPPG